MNKMSININFLVPKAGKAPKQRWLMLRNMACSLIKYERIETTEAKAKALSIMMRSIFDIFFSNNYTQKQKDILMQKLLIHPGAIVKLKENLSKKLGPYKGAEFLNYFNRIRFSSHAKMHIVELVKNKDKRMEDKEYLYFKIFYDNISFLDFSLKQKYQRLTELLNQHVIMTNLVEKIGLEINNNKEKNWNNSDLKELTQTLINKIPSHLMCKDVKLLMIDIAESIKFKSFKSGFTGIDYIKYCGPYFNTINNDIVSCKQTIKSLENIKENKTKSVEFDKKSIKMLMQNEKEDFSKMFKLTQNLITKKKEGIRSMIKKIKNEEQNVKGIMNVYSNLKFNTLEELNYVDKKKEKKRIREYRDTYSKGYNTGDESGFSDLEDVTNAPSRLKKFKKLLVDSNILNVNTLKGGRKVVRFNKMF